MNHRWKFQPIKKKSTLLLYRFQRKSGVLGLISFLTDRYLFPSFQYDMKWTCSDLKLSTWDYSVSVENPPVHEDVVRFNNEHKMRRTKDTVKSFELETAGIICIVIFAFRWLQTVLALLKVALSCWMIAPYVLLIVIACHCNRCCRRE